MMANRYTLSDGSIELMLEQRNEQLRPVVQILGTKTLAQNQRVRAVIYDGRSACQHCLFISNEIEQKCQRGEFEKFTVVRIEKYTITSIKDNPVVVVSDVVIIKNGSEIGKKLEPNEPIVVGNDQASSLLDDVLSEYNPTTTPNKQVVRKPVPESNVDIRPENVCPINVLTPFYNSWTIRALVVNKSALRTYNNKRGDGRFFNFDVCDDSGEIRITCFNEEVDRFFEMIEKDRVYYIGKGSIRNANKKFNTCNNDYECTLNSSSFVKLCDDGQHMDAPKLSYKFTPLASIANMDVNQCIDVIGIIRNVGQCETLVSRKTSKELIKRDVTLIDKSKHEARLTIWGEMAQKFDGQTGQVIALKAVSVGEFMGKTLSARDSTRIQLDPAGLPEFHLLQTWYRQLDLNQETFHPLSKSEGIGSGGQLSNNTRYVGQILVTKFQQGETKNFTSTATILAFNRVATHLYKSCGLNGCQKKVDEDQNGIYHCSKCDNNSPTFKWRLKMALLLADASGSFWATAFQESIEKMLGKTVEEMANLFETDQNAYSSILNQHLRFNMFTFKFYSRLDTYNNEIRVRHVISQVHRHKSPVERGQYLMKYVDVLQSQISA